MAKRSCLPQWWVLLVGLACTNAAHAVVDQRYVSFEAGQERFAVSVNGRSVPLMVSPDDHAGVIRVAKLFQYDVARVTGTKPQLLLNNSPSSKSCILIGTIGRSPIIDQLIRTQKLDVHGVAGRWDTFVLQVIDAPMPGIDQALVIAGSNKRGTIYGVFDLSAQMGVSPWNWWADVPVESHPSVYVLPGRHSQGTPAVKYRGIFINDEAPALAGWANEKFGGFNHRFYDKVFELILRLKGNYLWPAMWGRAIYDDDPESPKLADEYGVVIGTSHHEPLMRAHVEWRRYGEGPWNYDTNDRKLREFWTEGMRRMGTYESVITLGMRGDGDEPMTEEANIALLERIVADQRKIIEEVTGKPLHEIPQKWALYKEVQEYYDKGMRVPDDVTLLLCDDNWGNIRKLPKLDEPTRSGGYGIYYHFDYVGGPRNYKWLNTNPIPRVWEQMHLAYQHGVDRIWIVNVGDIKPMEFPIEFFLDYAWNPNKWPAERLAEYTRLWAAQQFGEKDSREIAHLLASYLKYNSRRKPEMLGPDTYSLVNYREAEGIVDEYNLLASKARRIYETLPSEYRDAFYQLVLYPIEACANLNELYVTIGKNRLYAAQGRSATNQLAQQARELFQRDAELTHYHNQVLADGKWSHMLDQTHIGYTNWQEPRENSMPEVEEIELPEAADMGVAIEGSQRWWPQATGSAVLPEFSRAADSSHTIDVFNRGRTPFGFSIVPSEPWVRAAPDSGTVEKEQRISISIDWTQVPVGEHEATVTVNGPNSRSVEVEINARNDMPRERGRGPAFVEVDRYVAMESVHYTTAVAKAPIRWQVIPDLGRTLSAMTVVPTTSASQVPEGDCPRLEYLVHLNSTGTLRVDAYVSPTLDFTNTQGLRYAVSFDDQNPQIINLHADDSLPNWERWVGNNINVTSSEHEITEPGEHVLKLWMVDPGVVLQKLVIDAGGVRPSYLGPPESPLSVPLPQGRPQRD